MGANEAGRRSSRPSEWTFFTFNTWDSQTAASTQEPLPRTLQGQEVVYGKMGAKQPCPTHTCARARAGASSGSMTEDRRRFLGMNGNKVRDRSEEKVMQE